MRASNLPLAIALALGGVLLLSGCKRPWSRNAGTGEASPEPEAKPLASAPPKASPKPTPLYIPQKRMETGRMFNGMQIRTLLETEPGETATGEGGTPSSYAVEVKVKVKIPKANRDLASLSGLNEALPKVLPGLAGMLSTATVSPSYEALYARKLASLQRNLTRLDALLSRHDFFDCETILQLREPKTRRAALLMQADMDVDTDGSDSDRLPAVDADDPTFQPMTSYRWPKQTAIPNPFLAGRQARLRTLELELSQARGLGASRLQALRDTVGAARYEVNQLRKHSFLLAAADPYVVLPGVMFEGNDPVFTPHVGDVCLVIYGDVLYPALVGDAGPNHKVGEASLRLAKELNAKATGGNRPVSALKVTYLVFPNSAEKPFGPPDLDRWHARAEALLKEFGGYAGKLHAWETISRPAPTPTPPPTPTPVPSPTATPAGSPSPSAASPTAEPPATPAASPSPELPLTVVTKKPEPPPVTGTGAQR